MSIFLPGTRVHRRDFVSTASLLASWPFLHLPQATAADRKVSMEDNPFQLGVASGDPSPDGFVLWTRLAPDPLNGGGMPREDVRVAWQVADDEGFKKVVQEGVATASADWAHAVHVEVSGLNPDRVYWYRFKVGPALSPVGRTRTAPRRDALLDKFRFAFASCQHWEAGYYTAYEHMVKDDLHAVVHLGDYIYEKAALEGRPRLHTPLEAKTLETYRARHALYKTDPALQAAHAAFPWIVTWDDHEVENNYADDISEKLSVSPEKFLKRRAAAYKAYYEHMPLRRGTLPKGPMMQLYRPVEFGRLIEFAVLDTRQHRSDQPCGDKRGEPCPEIDDPKATMLGEKQEQWLFNQLTQSQARWNVLAQQVMMARVDRMPGDKIHYAVDQWAGYSAPRTRLLQFLADRKPSNPVVLTGDIHSNWVNDLKPNFDDEKSPVIGTEFVGTSISSSGDGGKADEQLRSLQSENHFVKFFNAERGYVRCEITPDQWRSDYQVVPYVSRPGAPVETRASFVVENGRPGAERV